MTNNKTDVFETLKNIIGCEYISDMKFEPYRTKAKEALKSMKLSALSLSELKDLVMYLYEKQTSNQGTIFYSILVMIDEE